MANTSVITNHELATLRRESQGYMPDAIRVHGVTRSRTGSGGYTRVVGDNPLRTVRGRLAPMSEEEEQFYADRLAGRQGWTITVPAGTTVPDNALFKVGSRTFEIVGTDTGRSFQITQRYACQELT